MRRFFRAALVFLVLDGGLGVAQAFGQQGAASPSGGLSNLFDHFVVRGGWITWFVLIPLSVTTAALTFEYCLSIRRATVIPGAVADRLTELLEQRRYGEAVQFAADNDSVLAHVIQGGLAQAANGYPAMVQAMEEVLEERAAHLMRKIEYLNIIGNVSPMIGLFGTVVGIIRLFGSIGSFAGKLDAGEVAAALSIALVATYWGLLVGIPALSIFALFRNRVEALTTECAVVAERLVAVFRPAPPIPTGAASAVSREPRTRKPLPEMAAAAPAAGAPSREES